MAIKLEDRLRSLRDEESLLDLFASMGYDYVPDEPVNKSAWDEAEKDAVRLSKILSKTGIYKIYYVEIGRDDSYRISRSVAEKIIKNDRYSLVCLYNHVDSIWMFSSPTDVTGKPVCHIPVSVKDRDINPKDFVMVAKKMMKNGDDSAQTVFRRVAEAFNAFSDPERVVI